MDNKMSEKVRKGRKLPKAVRPEEWNKLIDVIPSIDNIARISFLLAYGSGMRISEVVRCKKEHFQTDGFIFIPESKYGVERKTPIPKGWRETFFKFLPIMRDSNKVPIESASRMLQRRFRYYSKLAGLNPLYTFHSLRHGFATRLLEGGTPINQVQLALGHSNISTTSIYIKANPQDLLKSYKENF